MQLVSTYTITINLLEISISITEIMTVLTQTGQTTREFTKIDTGGYVRTPNYDKVGINLSYSLRYEVSRRWMISASTIMTNKFYWDKKTNGSRGQNYEMNFVGLISDISIFYRFK